MVQGVAEIAWDDIKNQKLLRERGIGFETVLERIQEGSLLEVREHPHPERYPGQFVALVNTDDYVYVVPFAIHERAIFLKTIIPSRKETRRLLGGRS